MTASRKISGIGVALTFVGALGPQFVALAQTPRPDAMAIVTGNFNGVWSGTAPTLEQAEKDLKKSCLNGGNTECVTRHFNRGGQPVCIAVNINRRPGGQLIPPFHPITTATREAAEKEMTSRCNNGFNSCGRIMEIICNDGKLGAKVELKLLPKW